MSQHDMIIANASGATVRNDLNDALQALAGLNSGASAPATTYAYMLWADTTNGLLKMRNAANSAWISLGRLDGETLNIGGSANCFRLIKSGTDLTLQPVNGNTVDINDVLCRYTTMPTLGPGALSENTTYYIYLYDNAGAAALEASATGYTLDTKGRAYKTGNATRRLMGMARTVTGPAWIDTVTSRLVISRDNRLPLVCYVAFASDYNTASASFVELHSGSRLNVLTWADSLMLGGVSGLASNGTNGAQCTTALGLDGTTEYVGVGIGASPAAGNLIPIGFAGPLNAINAVAEGYHYATILGRVSAGTGTWYSATRQWLEVL